MQIISQFGNSSETSLTFSRKSQNDLEVLKYGGNLGCCTGGPNRDLKSFLIPPPFIGGESEKWGKMKA